MNKNEIMGYLIFSDNCPHCGKETTAKNDTVAAVYMDNKGIRFKCSHCGGLYTLKGGYQKVEQSEES